MVIRTQQHILALTVNRPPKRNLNFLSEFSESLSIALVKYMHREIQLGDFNLHVNDCSESRAVKFMDFVTSPTCEECRSQPWKYTGPSFYKGYWCWCFIYFTGSSFIIIFQRFSMYSKSSEPDTYTYIDTTARSILAECLPVILDSCSANSVSLNNLTDNLNSALLKTLDSYNQKIHLDEISAMVFRWHSNRLVESLGSCGVWQNKRFFTLPGKYKHSFPVLEQHISLNWNSNKKNNLWFLSDTVAKLIQNTSAYSTSLNAFLKLFTNKIDSIRDKVTGPHSPQNDGYKLWWMQTLWLGPTAVFHSLK